MPLPLLRAALLLALSAAMGSLPDAARAQGPAQDPWTAADPTNDPPNVVWFHHYISTEDWEGRRSYIQRAPRDKVKYSRWDGHTKAKLTYNMTGRFISEVFATQESDRETWLTDSGVWAGDVIRVKVPGAAPGQQSTLRITAQLALSGETRGYSEAQVCAGFIDLTHCQEDYADINGRLNLPLPRNVVELQRLGPLDVQVVIVGDHALVPLRFFLNNYVEAYPGEPEMHQRLEMNVSLQLPPGATCTSRSGRAFQRQCPAPSP